MAKRDLSGLRLLERLRKKTVKRVCEAVSEAASEFSLAYCFRNDCQHVGSNLSAAADLRREYGDLTVEEMLNNQKGFGELIRLMDQVLMSRGLVQAGHNPYDPKNSPVEFRSYATADDFVSRAA
jgi:hypothetical protein